MLEQTTITVGEEEVTITSLPATKALQLLTRTLSIVGGAGKGVKDFPSSLAEFQSLGADLEKYLNLGEMVEGLLSRVDGEMPEFIKGVIKDSLPFYQDRPEQFERWYETRFSRALGDQFHLLTEIYKWNFGDTVGWATSFFESPQEGANPDSPAPGQGPPS